MNAISPLRSSAAPEWLVVQVRSASGGLAPELDGSSAVLDGLQPASGGGQLELQARRVRDRPLELPASGVSVDPELGSLGPQGT